MREYICKEYGMVKSAVDGMELFNSKLGYEIVEANNIAIVC